MKEDIKISEEKPTIEEEKPDKEKKRGFSEVIDFILDEVVFNILLFPFKLIGKIIKNIFD
ncbi:hypothetical protein [Bacillus toyonensis]|uniref:hypothetical protein n=1 Tax=Bacillus toyonensis TaxID=155322 RepID=UPI000BF35429|nr:hypothetical protein [Bacillus toyonensis]PGF05138.1 hypothetical protein COM61_01565 [Bacillus toyonensis]